MSMCCFLDCDWTGLKVELVMISKWECSASQVDVIIELTSLALSEEDKSLKSRENDTDLLYCKIVINISVSVIAKVNCIFLFHLNNSKKLWWLIFLITSIITRFSL